MRILILEPSPPGRQSLKAFLATWSQIRPVYEAFTVCEVLHTFKELVPPAILVDVRIPAGKGLEAIQKIKNENHPGPIIVISIDPGQRSKATAAGADAFISKSDPPETLQKTLVDLFQKRTPHKSQSAYS